MPSNNRSPILPLIVFAGILVGAGAWLGFTSPGVFWPGLICMLVLYFVVCWIGWRAGHNRNRGSADEMMLAGRAMPLGLAVCTMSATWLGGGYINGTAEYVYRSDFGLVWTQAPWGYALSLIIGGLFFAGRMRKMGYHTMLDPLQQRYGQGMAAALFLPAVTGEIFWSAAILTALGATFGVILEVDIETAIILSAVIAIVYTMLGGLWAVAATDAFQVLLIFLGLGLVVVFAVPEAGGLAAMVEGYRETMGPQGRLFPPLARSNSDGLGKYYWQWWDSMLLLAFGGIAWQVYFQRVLAAKSAAVARNLSLFAAGICIAAAVLATLIGMAGQQMDWAALGVDRLSDAEGNLVLPYVIRYCTPVPIAMLGLGAIATAVMSSVDSSILSAASMATWNVYRPLVHPDASLMQLGKLIRRCIVLVGVAALLLALQVKSVYALWFLCSDFVYCILFPQLVCALYDRKANRLGSAAGLAVSAVLRFGAGEPALNLPRFLPWPMIEDGLVLFPFRTTAMLSSLIMIVVVSRCTQRLAPPTALFSVHHDPAHDREESAAGA